MDKSIRILKGYQGRPTDEQYFAPGVHRFPEDLAAYLVDNGHAEFAEAATSAVKRRPRKSKTVVETEAIE